MESEAQGQPSEDVLNSNILLLAQAKQDAILANKEVKELEEKIIDSLTRRNQKSASYRDGEGIIRVTLVRSETTEINEMGLKKALGAKKFNKLTDRKLNRQKLEKAMASGEVNAVIVAQNSAFSSRNPYIRLTESEQQRDDAN